VDVEGSCGGIVHTGTVLSYYNLDSFIRYRSS
jgi:hypothetical protein